MKKYHIYGIGNALVDYEIEINDSDLEQLNIEKGLMTLIDEERLNHLLTSLPGEHHKRACGGSAANTVIGAAKLGANCFYSCKIADDETGTFYADDLHREGVTSNLGAISKDAGHTGKCLVMITPDAERTMNTFLGITGDIAYSEVDESAMLASEWLYLEGYLVSSDPARDAAIKAKQFADKHSIKTAMSFCDPSMVKYFGDGLRDIKGQTVDMLFCNSEEAQLFTETQTAEEAFEKLKPEAKAFAMTLGAKGAWLWTGKEKIVVDPFPVKAIDTNGAGDLFAGAFMYGLTHGFSFEKAGKLASFASSYLVTEFGPRLSAEGLDKVRDFMSQLND